MPSADKHIYIIGAGPGSERLLSGEAREALGKVGLVLGAERLLRSLENIIAGKERMALTSVADIAQAARESARPVCAVLVSGDSGFFSLTKTLLPALRAEGFDCSAISGISSVSYFASRLGVSYDDAAVLSLHGRLKAGGSADAFSLAKERLLNTLAGTVALHAKTFLLTDSLLPPSAICRFLARCGFGKLRVCVGTRLSHPDERVIESLIETAAGSAPNADFQSPNVVYIENAAPRKPTAGNPPDSAFLRGNVPMTKEEVRTVSLSKLRLGRGAICWDVGAGTGSVACSAALAAPYGRVYAVERDAEALELIRRNMLKFGIHNMDIIAGAAPDALVSLPPPDAVFAGGTGGTLEAIVAAALARNPNARVVINAVTLETFALAHSLVGKYAHEKDGADIAQIGVSVAREAGAYRLLKAENPVFVISFGGAE